MFQPRWIVPFVILSAALAFSQNSPSADSPAKVAMLYAHGNVTVNGVNVPRAMAVMPGDKIQTDKDSAASIIAAGLMVAIPAGTWLIFRDTASLNAVTPNPTTQQTLTVTSQDKKKCISPKKPDKCD